MNIMIDFMKNKLVMVDLDGTLIDSKALNFFAYKEALSDFNISINEKEYEEFFGRNYKDFLSKIVSNEKLIELIHNKKSKIYVDNISKLKLNKHLENILLSIKHEYLIGLVTSASKKNTMKIVDYFKLNELFDDIITGDDVVKQKPDPMCYKILLDKYKISKDNIMIFEDSKVGIEAAKCITNNVFCVIN